MPCSICKSEFDDGIHQNCGGDCLKCMAVIGEDPECEVHFLSLIADAFWVEFSELCNNALKTVPPRLQTQLEPMLADRTSFYGRQI